MNQPPLEAAQATIERYLSEQNVRHHQVDSLEWIVSLPGPSGQDIQLQLRLGDYTLYFSSFFMRAPEANQLEVYSFLLRKNLELRAARFAINEVGDIFLTAELPIKAVTEEEIDHYLGHIYSFWDQCYGSVLRIGWAKYFQDNNGHH